MSVSFDSTYRYCDADDVARFHEQYDTFDTTTDPTKTEVEGIIDEWSAYIDRKTGQSWRENQVVDETHDGKNLYYWLSGQPVNLMKKNIITPLDDTAGDKLEIWDGNEWDEWVSDSTRTEGRGEDYWVDAPVGKLWVYDRNILRPHPKFRITYRYGPDGGVTDSDTDNVPDNVPRDIRMACAKLAARDLVTSDIYGTTVPGSERDSLSNEMMAQKWWDDAHTVIKDRKKIHFV